MLSNVFPALLLCRFMPGPDIPKKLISGFKPAPKMPKNYYWVWMRLWSPIEIKELLNQNIIVIPRIETDTIRVLTIKWSQGWFFFSEIYLWKTEYFRMFGFPLYSRYVRLYNPWRMVWLSLLLYTLNFILGHRQGFFNHFNICWSGNAVPLDNFNANRFNLFYLFAK